MKIDIEKRNFLLGIVISACVAALFSLTPVWQLILLSGIAGGTVNKRIRFGGLSGALGLTLYWILYIIDGVVFRNLYSLFDIFGAFIIGSGYGWLILFIVIVIGFLIGLFGGIIGTTGKNIAINLYKKRSATEKQR